MQSLIIKGLRVIDTRNDTRKTVIKELGDIVYFSDKTNCPLLDYNKYFIVANHENT